MSERAQARQAHRTRVRLVKQLALFANISPLITRSLSLDVLERLALQTELDCLETGNTYMETGNTYNCFAVELKTAHARVARARKNTMVEEHTAYNLPDAHRKRKRERELAAASAPEFKKGKWNSKEEDRLVELHDFFGNKWATIQRELQQSFNLDYSCCNNLKKRLGAIEREKKK